MMRGREECWEDLRKEECRKGKNRRGRGRKLELHGAATRKGGIARK